MNDLVLWSEVLLQLAQVTEGQVAQQGNLLQKSNFLGGYTCIHDLLKLFQGVLRHSKEVTIAKSPR